MSALPTTRSDRRAARAGSRTKATALAGAAATALSLGIGTPTAAAATPGPYPCPTSDETCYALPLAITGPLAALAAPFIGNLDPFTALEIFNFGLAPGPYVPSAPKKLYDQVNSYAYITPGTSPIGNYCANTGGLGQCRSLLTLSTGLGAFGLADASNALLMKGAGDTLNSYPDLAIPGSTPFGPITDAATGVTTLSGIYLNNPLRPDGGLAARFAPVLNLLGINTTLKSGVGTSDPNGNSAGVYVTDVTWPYNTFADFPVTANPFSVINSMFAAVPPVQQFLDEYNSLGFLGLLSNAAGTIASQANVGASGGPSSQIGESGSFAAPGIQYLALALVNGTPNSLSSQAYVTLLATQVGLPILYPTAILPALVNPLLKAVKSPYLLGNPLGDILAPAMKILVNIGYNDVITPDELDTPYAGDVTEVNPRTWAQVGYSAYDRSFFQTAVGSPTTFGSVNPLTSAEWAKVPGDVWTAFVDAVKAQAAKPFFGILEPNPAPTPSAAARPASAANGAVPTAAIPTGAIPTSAIPNGAMPMAAVTASAPATAPAPANETARPASPVATADIPTPPVNAPAEPIAAEPAARPSAPFGQADIGEQASAASEPAPVDTAGSVRGRQGHRGLAGSDDSANTAPRGAAADKSAGTDSPKSAARSASR